MISMLAMKIPQITKRKAMGMALFIDNEHRPSEPKVKFYTAHIW